MDGVDFGDGIGFTECRCRTFRETDVFGFAGFADFVEGWDGFFQWGFGINPMQIV